MHTKITVSAEVKRPTYSDEYLNYWCDEYQKHRLVDHNITLKQFLQAPQTQMLKLALRELVQINNLLSRSYSQGVTHGF